MKNSDDFPGFNEFDPKQQNAISIFMAFVSPDFDPANIDLKEETTAEKAFAGLLQKYVDERLVISMLELMKEKKVLKTFQELMADNNNKNKILGYVGFFKDIGEEPEEEDIQSKIDKVMEMAKKMVGKAVGKKVIKSISVIKMKKTDSRFSKSGIEYKELSVFPENRKGDFKGLMQQVGIRIMYDKLIKNNINPEEPFVYIEFREGNTEVYPVDMFLSDPPKTTEVPVQEQLANKLKPLIKEM